MIWKPFARKFLAISMLVLLAVSGLVQARPPKRPLLIDDGRNLIKLPPVNWIRSRQIDVKHIAIDLKFDWEKESAIGEATVTLAPFKDTDKIYLDAALMTIGSVTLANGVPLKYNYDGKKDGDNLEIFLDRVYPGGGALSVKVNYQTIYVNKADPGTAIGSFGRGLRFIKPTAEEPNKPRQIWSQGETEFNRFWFPSYDSPNDFRTTELRATVAKPFTVVSNGALVETKENTDGTRTFYWKMDTPYTNYLTSIVVGEYREVKNGEFDGIPVLAYGYPAETKEVALTTKNLVANIKFFSEKTGVKYPYAKYAQTFVEDFGGGMENITATTQIEEMIHDERELLDGDSESLQSHELAHQWFGNFVTCREWGQVWLNESFATYLQALWDQELKGHDFFLYNDVRNNQQEYLKTWNEGSRRPIVTKYYADKDALFDNYAYPRGAAVLHMLRKHLGDRNWWKALNLYLVSNANQPVSTEEFRIAIEEATGESMDWFFDQWLYKMGHPVFEVTQNYDQSKKKLTLYVKQTQQIDPANEYPQVRYFQTKVDIEIDGRVEQVWIEPQEENVFTFEAPEKPKIVNFDYEGTLIKELKFEKPVDELIYQMQNDRDIPGKRWAMEELEAKAAEPNEKTKIMAAFLVSVENEKNWNVRRAALSKVNNLSLPQTASGEIILPVKLSNEITQTVLKAVKDEQSLIRADAIELLGATKDPKYADLYLAALNDRSYGVIDAAALALGGSKSAKAFDALVKLTKSPSWKGRVESAGFAGLAALADRRAFEVSYKFANDKKNNHNARMAALETVGATGKGDERAFSLIFGQFEVALDENDFAGNFKSAQGFIKLADPRGQWVFDMMKAKYKGRSNLLENVYKLEKQFKDAVGR